METLKSILGTIVQAINTQFIVTFFSLSIISLFMLLIMSNYYGKMNKKHEYTEHEPGMEIQSNSIDIVKSFKVLTVFNSCLFLASSMYVLISSGFFSLG